MIKQLGVCLRRCYGITIVIGLSVGILPHSTAAAQGDWAQLGPQGHQIRSITTDPGNADIVYTVAGHDLSGKNQGIYKSLSNGSNWTRLDANLWDTTGETANLGVSHLAVDGLDSNTLYGWFNGLNNQRLLTSQDGGLNWSLLDVGFSYIELLVAPDQASTLYAYQIGSSDQPPPPSPLPSPSPQYALHKSTDGGQNWSEFNLPLLGFLRRILISPTDGDVLYLISDPYAGVPSPQVLLKSEDGGLTWSGASPLPSGNYQWGFVIDPQNPAVLYLQALDTIWKSEDSGVSWTIISQLQIPEAIAAYINGLYINPNDPERFYLSGLDVFYQSDDGGLSWRDSSAEVPDIDNNALAFDPETADRLYLGNKNGVYKSIDNAQSWIDSSSGLNTGTLFQIEIDPQQPAVIYGYNSREVLRSGDYGVNWSRFRDGISFPYNHVIHDIDMAPSAPNIMYLTVEKTLFKSTDAGEHWVPVAESAINQPVPNNRIIVDPQNPDIVYGIYYASAHLPPLGQFLLKSSDGGASWNEVETGLGNDYYSWIGSFIVDPNDSNRLYASLAEGLYRSIDGADSWQLIAFAGQQIRALVIAPITSSTLYASITDQGIFKSTNAGQNWVLLESELPNLSSLTVSPSNPQVIYGVASFTQNTADLGIYRSLDGGQTWSFFNSGPGEPLLNIQSLKIDPQYPDTLYVTTATGLYVHNAVNSSIFSDQFE